MEFDDPNYRQARTGGETWGILRGVDEEKIPLAIQAYEMFMAEETRLKKELEAGTSSEIKLTIDICTNFWMIDINC